MARRNLFRKRWKPPLLRRRFIPSVVAAGSPVPTLTDITARRVFQRASGVASVTIAGTYTNTAVSIQARVVLAGSSTEVVTWTTIVASPSGGTFSGSLSVPEGGWYNVQVRDSSNTGSPSNGSNSWGVGDIFAVTGQSNGDYAFWVGSSVTASSTTAVYDDTGWGANTGSGSRTIANALTSYLGVPVAMLRAATSGSGLVTSTGSSFGSWDNPGGTPYLTFASRMAAVGGKLAGVLWLQGEWDASAGVTKAAYKSALTGLIAQMRTDTGQAALPFFIVPLTRCTTGTWPDWDNVQDAFLESVTSTVIKACDTWDLSSGDGLHYDEAGQIALGGRLSKAIYKYLGGSVESLGPYLSSVSVSGSDVDCTFAHLSGTDLTPSSAITGLTFTDGGSPITPTSVVKQSSTVVRAAFSSPPAGAVYVAVATGQDPVITGALLDSAGLPAQRTTTAGITTSVTSSPVATSSRRNQSGIHTFGTKR